MIEVSNYNYNYDKCYICNMKAETRIYIGDGSARATVRHLCESCEHKLYTKLHEHRQSKLSNLLTNHNRQQK